MLFQIEVENNAYETCPETQSFSKHWTTVSLAWISHETGWIRNTHYLSVPVGWHPSYLFHHGPALQSCTCMWKHCVWSGLSLLNCKSYHPDWFLFEPEALLLSLISTLPGLQQDPRLPNLSEDPMKYRAHCTIQALNSYRLQCYWILWQLIHSTSKAFGPDGISDEKVL